MTRLADLVGRPPPEPWSGTGKIPWHEPRFSERMLREHLSQLHDAASRRRERIDRHVAWLAGAVLAPPPGRVLDLGCGPGLYTERLARRGYSCLGVDFSPASIAHARAAARAQGLACEYLEADLRTADLGSGHDAALLLYGELHTFPREQARALLASARAALAPGGQIVLEVHDEPFVRGVGARPRRWDALGAGLFSDAPHLWLRESAWSEALRASAERHLIVDAASGEVREYVNTLQAYSEEELRELLRGAGFGEPEHFASLTGEEPAADGLFVLRARAAGTGAGRLPSR